MAIGVAATAGVVALHALGSLDRFELDMLDLRFRDYNKLGASDLILHVHIGDDAFERIHRWPWPRRLHAQLIATLHELGARAVVMDILFSEHQPPRLDPRAVAAIETSTTQQAGERPPMALVFDDRELSRAIEQAGNVYLTTFYHAAQQGDPRQRVQEWVDQAVEQHPEWTTRQVIGQVRARRDAGDLSDEALKRLCRRAHLAWLLERDFGRNVRDLANRTGIPRGEVDEILPGLKKWVARALTRQAMAHKPGLTADQLVQEIMPHPPRDPLDVQDMLAAHKVESAILAALERTAPIPPGRESLYPSVERLTPPLEQFARVAKDNGFVIYDTGSKDGVLREIPLVACYRGRMLRQLAFAALCDVLDVPPEGVAIDKPGQLVIRGARVPEDPARRDVILPIDDRGRFLLNWRPCREGWERSFPYVAVGRVLEIPLNRSACLAQRHRVRAMAVKFTTDRGAASAYEQYVKLIQARDRAERDALTTATQTSQPAPSRVPDEIAKRIHQIEENAIGVIHSDYEEIRDLEPENDEERREFDQIRQLHHDLLRVEQLGQRIEERIAELRPLVTGKVCFVGYTATAVADFVGTPVFERGPGVMAHSNLFHTLHTRALVRRSPRWLDVLLIVACGLVSTLITTQRGPIFSLLAAAVALNVAVVAAALWLFYQWHIWIIVPAVVTTILATWALITVYRQLTEGREKREVSNRLGQYTSPSLARRIAEDPEALGRAEVREVTCYFSDLKGFTGISEVLGAERTQALLNVYLERMSEVLDRHEAFINKFLGDGVFAFFNPAVNPQPEHPLLACEASLDSLVALDELTAEQRQLGGDEAFQQLRCRIGLATGNAVVGNCGSDRKFDYTCIGDTVNLAARLEPANKAFGTQIMVAEPTRARVADRYEWRYLGGLQVVGKSQMVPVYEILGRKGTVDDDVLEYASRFEEGVRIFQEGRWVDCLTHFSRMLARRPDDPGLMLYMDRCQEFQRFRPPEDWNGAIELKEK